MYSAINDVRLSQGDIINNVVFASISDISDPPLYVRDQDDSVERDLTQQFDPAEDLTVLAQALKSPVLVVTPNCNIDKEEFICVAPIYTLTHEIDEGYFRAGSAKKKAKYLKSNYQHAGVNPTVYYLQESLDVGFPKSLASLLEIQTIQKTRSNLEYLLANRILRLSGEAVGDLQYRIGAAFGRYALTVDDYMLTADERALLARPAVEDAQAVAHNLPPQV